MIHTTETLRQVLAAGLTLARMAVYDGKAASVWCIVETGEPVHAFAVRPLLSGDELTAVQTDLFDLPFQYRSSSPPPPQIRHRRRPPVGAGSPVIERIAA